MTNEITKQKKSGNKPIIFLCIMMGVFMWGMLVVFMISVILYPMAIISGVTIGFPWSKVDIEYVNEPFMVTYVDVEDYYDDYKPTETTAIIESIEMVSAWRDFDRDIRMEFEIIGILKGSDYLEIGVLCYDDEDFVIDKRTLYTWIVEDERFRTTDWIWAPPGTVRIQFVKDEPVIDDA